jgi:hypothetical protein
MSRTREIDVYADKYAIESLLKHTDGYQIFIRSKKSDRDDLKCKLIIELPERKVTISESEFNKLVGTTPTADVGWIRNKLFKDA